MSLKWTGNQSESGILRKIECKEKKEELFVFGYSCKLFRDDERAIHIDQGKHLIPWMGDETLKIDRYDARGALHDLSTLEAPPGGFDWRVELTRAEQDVEQLCDEERYRALHTDEDEEEMYKEEELKRLHAAGYGQVGFNYDAPTHPTPAAEPAEVDEPFVPTPAFEALLPIDTVLPDSLKQNAIIEKTAKFIAAQGVQMEILIKAKQGDNPQFQFLNKDSTLHPYYTTLIGLVKSGKWPEKKVEVVEEKPSENEDYLHPSLASTIIESAPAIPSIHYKPSADCDYALLINKMRDDGECEAAAGDVPPPGTEPAAPHAHIYRPPVIYARPPTAIHDATSQLAQPQYQQFAAYHQQQVTSHAPGQVINHKPAFKEPPPTPLKSTGLSLMKNYNTDSDSDVSDFDDCSSTDSKDKLNIATPPDDVKIVIDKMAAYVARNGDEFADIVRAKNDPRFTFLDPDNVYHAFYKRLMNQKRGIDANGVTNKGQSSAPVSFSIKKLKEPDPILPKPALPYESSTDDESEKTEKQTEKPEDVKEPPRIQQQLYTFNNIPPAVVYKMEGQLTNNLPTVTTIEPLKPPKQIIKVPEETPKDEEKLEMKVDTVPEVRAVPVVEVKEPIPEKVEERQKESPKRVSPLKRESPNKRVSPHRREESHKRESPYKRDSSRRDKRKHRDRKKESSKSQSRDRRSDRRSVEREKMRERDNEREKKRRKHNKEELENEIISLVDNSDDLIDLTGDQSDTKGEWSPEAELAKQQTRRRRAAEFLQKVGVDPAAATALPATSLASAMVDTLESIRKKKAEEEEKRRRRDKRRHRDRRDYDDESHKRSKRRKYRSSEDNDDSDYEGSKKKKRKKDKKQSSKNKKKRRRESENEEEDQIPINIDLTNTLKELRTCSPTKDVLQGIEDSLRRHESSQEEFGDRKKREYSEGEWSSDSEVDSRSSNSRKED